MAELLLQWQEGVTQRSERITSRSDDPTDTRCPTVKIGRDPQQCDIVLADQTVANCHVEIACDATDRCYLRWSPPEQVCEPPLQHPVVNGQALKTDAIVLDTVNTLQLGQVCLNIAIKPESVSPPEAMGPYCPLPSPPNKVPRRPSSPQAPPLRPVPPSSLVWLVLALLLSIVTMGSVFMVTSPRKLKYVDVPLDNYDPTRLPVTESTSVPQPLAAPSSPAPTLTIDQLTDLTQAQLTAQNVELVTLSCPQSRGVTLGQSLSCEATVADVRPFTVQITPTSLSHVQLKPETGIFFAKDVEERMQHWMQAQGQIAGQVSCDRTIILDYADQQFTCQAQTPSGTRTVVTQVEGYDLTFEFRQPLENPLLEPQGALPDTASDPDATLSYPIDPDQ